MTPATVHAAIAGGATRFGKLSAATVARAAGRVLMPSFLLGELDGDDELMQIGAAEIDSAAHRALALAAARQSLVLLQNPSNVLPLANTTSTTNTSSGALAAASGGILFVGPHATTTQGFLSDYHGLSSLVEGQSPLAVSLAWFKIVASCLCC